MKCPIDGTALVMTDRAGVEIDYCPECRGVWLDRGELDKIVERSAPPPPPGGDQYYEEEYEAGPERSQGRSPQRRKKRGGFLEELFDF